MFTVRWRNSARDALAAIWVEADSALRKEITAAADQIDQELSRDPDGRGESRGVAERIWFVFPLGLWFKVDRKH